MSLPFLIAQRCSFAISISGELCPEMTLSRQPGRHEQRYPMLRSGLSKYSPSLSDAAARISIAAWISSLSISQPRPQLLAHGTRLKCSSSSSLSLLDMAAFFQSASGQDGHFFQDFRLASAPNTRLICQYSDNIISFSSQLGSLLYLKHPPWQRGQNTVKPQTAAYTGTIPRRSSLYGR